MKLRSTVAALLVIAASISIGALSGYLVAATNHNPYIMGVTATGIGSLALLLVFSPSYKSEKTTPEENISIMSIIVFLLCASFFVSSVEASKDNAESRFRELIVAEDTRHEIEYRRLLLCSEREKKINKLRGEAGMSKLNSELFCETAHADLVKQISANLITAPDGRQWNVKTEPVDSR